MTADPTWLTRCPYCGHQGQITRYVRTGSTEVTAHTDRSCADRQLVRAGLTADDREWLRAHGWNGR